MSTVGTRPIPSFSRRKPLTRIVVARGQRVRAFTLRPWLVATIGVVVSLIGVTYLAATAYLFFRDDLLTSSITRQVQLQRAYEDRIAALRAEIDRLTSRNLLNQQTIETKLESLLERQAVLDQRQDVLAQLGQAARRAGVIPAMPKPAPPRPGDNAAVEPDALPTGSIEGKQSRRPPAAATLRGGPAGDTIARLDEAGKMELAQSSMDSLSRGQLAFVERLAEVVSERTVKMKGALKGLAGDLPEHKGAGGVGGPFVPLPVSADPETFRISVALIAEEIERLAALREVAGKLPLLRPVSSGAVSSGFGPRLDPFLGKPALHQGVDFRAADGHPVRATAAGTVVSADYSGGYGKLVEIDHGGGITTRFAHLSRILVRPGQRVAKGALIGRTGSTGRSTGPHLHYEVRLRGEPVDPMRYISAGRRLVPLL